MRIRCKPWARPELEASSFFISDPKNYKNQWQTVFANQKPIYLELGCGKGGFASQAILHWQDVNFIAIECGENQDFDDMDGIPTADLL